MGSESKWHHLETGFQMPKVFKVFQNVLNVFVIDLRYITIRMNLRFLKLTFQMTSNFVVWSPKKRWSRDGWRRSESDKGPHYPNFQEPTVFKFAYNFKIWFNMCFYFFGSKHKPKRILISKTHFSIDSPKLVNQEKEGWSYNPGMTSTNRIFRCLYFLNFFLIY